MQQIVLAHEVDWQGWRDAARALALSGTSPDDVTWSVHAAADLFGDIARPAPAPGALNLNTVAGAFTLKRALVQLAETVIQSNDPERFSLLYRLIVRAHAGEPGLLEQVTDPQVMRATRLAQSVRRDTHKMRAFLRFREVTEDDTTRYVAWFEPDHYIVESNAGFFVRRFAGMTWSILTPYRSVHWDGTDLHFAAGAARSEIPNDDHVAEYWRTYFAAIFNPAA